MVRKINAKLVLRLRAEGFSLRQIEAQGISQHSSIKVVRAAAREHLTWETAAGMTENEVYEGSAEALLESECFYAANSTASIIMASNSTGVSRPSPRCLRFR